MTDHNRIPQFRWAVKRRKNQCSVDGTFQCQLSSPFFSNFHQIFTQIALDSGLQKVYDPPLEREVLVLEHRFSSQSHFYSKC